VGLPQTRRQGDSGRRSVISPPASYLPLVMGLGQYGLYSIKERGQVMSSDVTKRALSAGLGVGALALLAPRASADTPFSSFAFPATGAPTARTMPDRLADTKNVKDFGARGNGSTDDTAAIQAAITAAHNSGGIVFFPPGNYRVTSTVRA
jgi:polygalacturonase